VLHRRRALAGQRRTEIATVEVSGAADPAPEDDVRFESLALGKHRYGDRPGALSAAGRRGEIVVSGTTSSRWGAREYAIGYFSRAASSTISATSCGRSPNGSTPAGFRIDGEVVIQRPRPSWWRRLFIDAALLGAAGADRSISSRWSSRPGITSGVPDSVRFRAASGARSARRLWCGSRI